MRTRIHLPLALAALLSPVELAVALPITEATASAAGSTCNLTGTDSMTHWNSASASTAGATLNSSWNSHAFSNAESGNLHTVRLGAEALAIPSGLLQETPCRVGSRASASFYDELQVTNPDGVTLAGPGGDILLHLPILTDGEIFVGNGSLNRARVFFAASLNAMRVGDDPSFRDSDQFELQNVNQAVTHDTALAVRLDADFPLFSLFMFLDVEAIAEPGMSEARAAFSETAKLFPFYFTDINGEPIPGSEKLVVTGSSGIRYAVEGAAIPEPAAFVQILSGILLLSGWFRVCKSLRAA